MINPMCVSRMDFRLAYIHGNTSEDECYSPILGAGILSNIINMFRAATISFPIHKNKIQQVVHAQLGIYNLYNTGIICTYNVLLQFLTSVFDCLPTSLIYDMNSSSDTYYTPDFIRKISVRIVKSARRIVESNPNHICTSIIKFVCCNTTLNTKHNKDTIINLLMPYVVYN